MNATVGFQGEPGAFSEEAALALFPAAQTRGYASFDALIAGVDAREVRFALLPCENTIHGSIARSYDLLFAHPRLQIVGAIAHRIVQCLIGTHDATLAGITHVESHPVALEQCRGFLGSRPDIEVRVAADTAGAVRSITERADPGQAAIGPARSAQRYGAQVLLAQIADEAENFTRFFVVERGGQPLSNQGRACLACVLPHRPGSLYRALGEIDREGWNLHSLVTRPRSQTPFEYVFYLEFDCPSAEAAAQLRARISRESRVLGWY